MSFQDVSEGYSGFQRRGNGFGVVNLFGFCCSLGKFLFTHVEHAQSDGSFKAPTAREHKTLAIGHTSAEGIAHVVGVVPSHTVDAAEAHESHEMSSLRTG